MVLKSLTLLSTFTLGIFLGSQIAEAILLVPYWKELSSDNFFILHKTYGERLYQFYAPLTIAATIFPTATLVFSLINNSKRNMGVWLMFMFTILFFSTYYIYFKEANLSFVNRTISNEALPNELIKWGNWHWFRVFCETGAFICGLVLLQKSEK